MLTTEITVKSDVLGLKRTANFHMSQYVKIHFTVALLDYYFEKDLTEVFGFNKIK